MKKLISLLTLLCVAILITGCATKQKQVEPEPKPVVEAKPAVKKAPKVEKVVVIEDPKPVYVAAKQPSYSTAEPEVTETYNEFAQEEVYEPAPAEEYFEEEVPAAIEEVVIEEPQQKKSGLKYLWYLLIAGAGILLFVLFGRKKPQVK